MESFKKFQHQKTGVCPHQIVFEKENVENTYISWKDKMKPRIELYEGITSEEYQALASRWEEMLSIAEEIIYHCYLDPTSDELMSEEDSFPDIRYLTGNYYVGEVYYNYTYRDKKNRPYKIKEGRLRHKYHNGKEWLEEWLPLDSPEITRYYQILLCLRLTSKKDEKDGEEMDYMGLDLVAELEKLDDAIEFEILSHNVI